MAQESKTPAPFRTSIGGQALIEGILMRGVDRQAIVCRKSDGTLVSRVDPLKLSKDRHPWMGYPFIRGVVNFLDSMVNGVKAITWSAEQQPEDEQGEPDKFDLWIQKHFSDETAEKIILYTAVVLGIALSVGLFALLPTFRRSFEPARAARRMARPCRGYFPPCDLSRLSQALLDDPGYEARVDVSRRGA